MSFDKDRSACVNDELPQTEKIKLILSKDLMAQVNYLHSSIGKDEWSGILLYKVLEGEIENPGSLVLQADYIYPMDIGTSAYTEFDYDEAYIDMHDRLPIIEDGKRIYKIGTIHTHHNMSTFFSGTDTGELHTNSPKHNYYLSLIVNFGCDYIAKVAMHSPASEYVIKLRGTSGDFERKVVGGGTLVIYDCEILLENDEWFYERFEEVKEKKKNKRFSSPIVTSTNFNRSHGTANYYDRYPDFGGAGVIEFPEEDEKKSKKDKKKEDRKRNIATSDGASEHQLLQIICRTISGNMNEYSDLYNVLKREDAALSKKTKNFDPWGYVEHFKTNFKKACAKYKDRENVGRFELDELAEACGAVIKSYKFDKYNGIIDTLIEALEAFEVKTI